MSFELLINSWPMLLTAMGLGLLHALDADHIMAVSMLSNEKMSLRCSLRFCLQWAVGHAVILMGSGALLLGLGLAIPRGLQVFAEALVGVLLIGLGFYSFWQIRKQRLALQPHSHGDVEHTHWLKLQLEQRHSHETIHSANLENHAPVLVGMLHGLAGSAPALVLIPVIMRGQLFDALLYLLLFSLGTIISMVLFGLGLGTLQKQLRRYGERLFMASRQCLASVSILMGAYWLVQAA